MRKDEINTEFSKPARLLNFQNTNFSKSKGTNPEVRLVKGYGCGPCQRWKWNHFEWKAVSENWPLVKRHGITHFLSQNLSVCGAWTLDAMRDAVAHAWTSTCGCGKTWDRVFSSLPSCNLGRSEVPNTNKPRETTAKVEPVLLLDQTCDSVLHYTKLKTNDTNDCVVMILCLCSRTRLFMCFVVFPPFYMVVDAPSYIDAKWLSSLKHRFCWTLHPCAATAPKSGWANQGTWTLH